MGATEFAPLIRKRYQTNELAISSTDFGTRGRRFKSSLPDQLFKRPRVALRVFRLYRRIGS